MKILRSDEAGIAVLGLSGRLVAGTGDAQLRDAVNDVLADGRKQIVLDLAEVSGIDSSGVGELVASKRVAGELDATIHLVKRAGPVEDVLSMTQILPLFEVFESREDAANAFEDGV